MSFVPAAGKVLEVRSWAFALSDFDVRVEDVDMSAAFNDVRTRERADLMAFVRR